MLAHYECHSCILVLKALYSICVYAFLSKEVDEVLAVDIEGANLGKHRGLSTHSLTTKALICSLISMTVDL